MDLTVLAVPGCPNAPVLGDRLAAVVDGRAGVSVSHQVISDEDEAARWGMHGSPTLLIDGVDPFAEPGQPPSMSCRLYRDDDGRTSGAPSASQLRQAIEQAAATTEPADLAWLDSAGRGGRGRIAPADRGLRAVHQAVLRSFVHTGAAPDLPSLARHAAPFEVSQVLAELADGDFLCLDPAGQITAAYPFSALPTRHRVRITGEATVFAMCAIDALGISAMTGRPVVIESADPSTGAAGHRARRPGQQHLGSGHSRGLRRPDRRRVRWAVGIGLLRVHELLRHPGSRLGVGSLPSGHHRRHPQPSPRPASRHRHLRPATPLTSPPDISPNPMAAQSNRYDRPVLTAMLAEPLHGPVRARARLSHRLLGSMP